MPMRAAVGTTTFLSMMQRCSRAPAPMCTPGKMIESVTCASWSMYVPGPMIERSTCEPDTIEP